MSGKELRKMARAMVKERRGAVLWVVLAAMSPTLLYAGVLLYSKLAGPHGWADPTWLLPVVSYAGPFVGTVLMFGGIRALANQASGGEKPFEGFFFYANRELMGRALLLALILAASSAALSAIPGAISQYGMTLAKPVGYEETGFGTSLPIYGENYQLGSSLIMLGGLLGLGVNILLIVFSFSAHYRFAFHPEDGVLVQIKEFLNLGKNHFGRILAMNVWLSLPAAGFAVVWGLFTSISIAASSGPLFTGLSLLISISLLALGFIFYMPYVEVAQLLLAEDLMGLLPKKQKKAKRKKA